jgi:hypothetical protein
MLLLCWNEPANHHQPHHENMISFQVQEYVAAQVRVAESFEEAPKNDTIRNSTALLLSCNVNKARSITEINKSKINPFVHTALLR